MSTVPEPNLARMRSTKYPCASLGVMANGATPTSTTWFSDQFGNTELCGSFSKYIPHPEKWQSILSKYCLQASVLLLSLEDCSSLLWDQLFLSSTTVIQVGLCNRLTLTLLLLWNKSPGCKQCHLVSYSSQNPKMIPKLPYSDIHKLYNPAYLIFILVLPTSSSEFITW